MAGADSAPYLLSVLDDFRSQLEAAAIEIITANVKERLAEEDLLSLVSTLMEPFVARIPLLNESRAAPKLKVILKRGTCVNLVRRITNQDDYFDRHTIKVETHEQTHALDTPDDLRPVEAGYDSGANLPTLTSNN